jgi:hypothetical protein
MSINLIDFFDREVAIESDRSCRSANALVRAVAPTSSW